MAYGNQTQPEKHKGNKIKIVEGVNKTIGNSGNGKEVSEDTQFRSMNGRRMAKMKTCRRSTVGPSKGGETVTATMVVLCLAVLELLVTESVGGSSRSELSQWSEVRRGRMVVVVPDERISFSMAAVFTVQKKEVSGLCEQQSIEQKLVTFFRTVSCEALRS